MKEIRFEFVAAENEKLRISEIRRQMDAEVVSGFDQCRSRISEAWEGNVSCRFHEATGREQEKIIRTVKLLERAELSLENAIQTARRVEEKTKEIAESRRN